MTAPLVIGPYHGGEIPPSLTVIFDDSAGNPISLTGFTATFSYRSYGGPWITRTAQVDADQVVNKGQVHYTWVAADFSVSGDFEAEMLVSGGSNQYYSRRLAWQTIPSVTADTPISVPPVNGHVSTLTVDALGLGIAHSSLTGVLSSSLIVDADVTAVGASKITFNTARPFILASSLGCAGNGTDDSLKLMNGIATLSASAIGGDLILDQPTYGLATGNSGVDGVGLAISNKNVMIRGSGGPNYRNSAGVMSGSTTLKALTAGMKMIQFAPPASGSTDRHGFGGVDNVYFNGNASLAAMGLEVLSWSYIRLTRLGFNDFTTGALHIGVIPSWDQNDARNSIWGHVEQISIGGTTPGAGYGMRIDGDTTALAQAGDTAKFVFKTIFVFFLNGDAIQVGGSDNCYWENLHLFRGGGGTGRAMLFEGAAAGGQFARAHSLHLYTANAPTVVQGTESGWVIPSTKILFTGYDNDNGTPAPTVGTGCSVTWQDHDGKSFGNGVVGTKVAVDGGTAALPSYALTTDATTGNFQAAGASFSTAISAKERWRITTTSAIFSANAVALGTVPITSLATLAVHGADASQNSLALASYGATPSLLFRRADGTAAALTALVANDTIGAVHVIGYEATTPAFATQKTAYQVQSTDAWTTAAQGFRHLWTTTATGTVTNNEKMRLEASGSLLVGTTTDGMTAAGSLAIAQDLAHRGTKLGAYNVAPVTQPAGASDVLASLVTLGLRAASANPPLNLGTGTVTAGVGAFGDGTAGAPSYAFGSDGTTGVYKGAGATIGVATAGAERLRVAASVFMVDQNAVAMNTVPITSLAAFTLHGADASQVSIATAAYGGSPSLMWRRANGTAAALTALASGDAMGTVHVIGYEATTPAFTGQKPASQIQSADAWTTAAQGYRHVWNTTAAGGVTNNEKMRLESTGSLLVGTTTDGMTAAGSLAVSQDLAHRGTKAGFYNVATVTRAGAITAPTAPSAGYVQAEAQSMKTAVDAIRVALTNLGLTS